MNYKAWTQIKSFAILIKFALSVSHNCSIRNIFLHYELSMISNMVISNIALATYITFLRFLSYMNCMAVSWLFTNVFGTIVTFLRFLPSITSTMNYKVCI